MTLARLTLAGFQQREVYFGFSFIWTWQGETLVSDSCHSAGGAGPLRLEAEAGLGATGWGHILLVSQACGPEVLQAPRHIPESPSSCSSSPRERPDHGTQTHSRPLLFSLTRASLRVQAPGKEEAASKIHLLLSCPTASTLVLAPTAPAYSSHMLLSDSTLAPKPLSP